MFDIFDDLDFFQFPMSYKEELRCPVCNKTYTNFKSTGKLGCSKCYEVFAPYLSPVIRQIHQNPVHTGKIPQNKAAKLSKKRKLEILRANLQQAVKDEDYETAAKIHKEITEIEKG